MNVHFITCSEPTYDYRDQRDRENRPVNLALCKSVEKTRLRWYPDNEGRPSISFHGCDTEWVFSTDRARDAEYDRIITAGAQHG